MGLGQFSFSTFTFPRFPIGIKWWKKAWRAQDLSLRIPWHEDFRYPALNIKLRSTLNDTFIFQTTSNICQSHHRQAIKATWKGRDLANRTKPMPAGFSMTPEQPISTWGWVAQKGDKAQWSWQVTRHFKCHRRFRFQSRHMCHNFQ